MFASEDVVFFPLFLEEAGVGSVEKLCVGLHDAAGNGGGDSVDVEGAAGGVAERGGDF